MKKIASIYIGRDIYNYVYVKEVGKLSREIVREDIYQMVVDGKIFERRFPGRSNREAYAFGILAGDMLKQMGFDAYFISQNGEVLMDKQLTKVRSLNKEKVSALERGLSFFGIKKI